MADHFRPPNSAEIAARQRKVRAQQDRERSRWQKREHGPAMQPQHRRRTDTDDPQGET